METSMKKYLKNALQLKLMENDSHIADIAYHYGGRI